MPSDQSDIVHVAQSLITQLPYAVALQMNIVAFGSGAAAMKMRVLPDLCDAGGVLHEGALTALMDTCAGSAVMAHDSEPLATVTLDLRLDLIGWIAKGTVLAKAECYAIKGNVAFVTVAATDQQTGALLAKASGSFTVEYGPEGKGGLETVNLQTRQG
ncbi:thioesterase [Rhodobacterales bacterium LSUCC0246]|nr:thioesterase [Rhodobacterales bacterium LSUCC0374]